MKSRNFSVEGVRQMQDALDGWSPERMIAWLHDGFACLADKARYAEWNDAFPPLRFHPGSDPRAQFAAALREAHRAEHSWPGKLRRAAEARLRELSDAGQEEANITVLADLWSCIEATGFTTGDIPIARRISALAKARQGEERAAARDLLLRIANAAAAAPPSGTQYQFFVNCLFESEVWDAGMLVSYVYARLHDDATEADHKELLRDLAGQLRKPLIRAADPATVAGRLLVGALLDWLDGTPGDEMAPPLDAAAASEGLLRILGLADCVVGTEEPSSVTITQSRKVPLPSKLGMLLGP